MPVEKARAFEEAFHRFMVSNHREILEAADREKALSEATVQALEAAIREFKQSVPY